jgi:hypothetical protein
MAEIVKNEAAAAPASSSATSSTSSSPRVQLKTSLRGLEFQAQEQMLQPLQRKRAQGAAATPVVQREEAPASASAAGEFDADPLYQDAELVSEAYGEARPQLEGILANLPAGAQAEVQAVLLEVASYDTEMWDALEAAVASHGDAADIAAFQSAMSLLDYGSEMLEAYHTLWQAYLAANILSLLQGLAGLALEGIENLKARLAELEVELRALEKKVAAAKQDLMEVAAQTGIDIVMDLAIPAVMAAAIAANPPVGLLLAVGGFIITYSADNFLGVDTEGAHKQLNNANDGLDGLASGTEGATEIIRGTGGLGPYGVKLAGAAELAGKATAGLSLALDAWEAKIGYENLAALRAEVQKTIDKANQLNALWALVEPHVAKIQRVASGLKTVLPNLIATIGQERDHIAGLRAQMASL